MLATLIMPVNNIKIIKFINLINFIRIAPIIPKHTHTHTYSLLVCGKEATCSFKEKKF